MGVSKCCPFREKVLSLFRDNEVTQHHRNEWKGFPLQTYCIAGIGLDLNFVWRQWFLQQRHSGTKDLAFNH